MRQNIQQRRLAITGKKLRDDVHQDFGVGVPSQMKIGDGQDFFFELFVIRQLTVEAESEPFVFFDMMPLKRLSVATVIGTACCVADMSNRSRCGIASHQFRGFGLMIQVEHFGDRTDVFVSFEQLRLAGSIHRHPRGELSSILNLQQQPRHVARHMSRIQRRFLRRFRRRFLVRVLLRRLNRKKSARFARQIVDRGNSTLVIQIGHNMSLREDFRFLAGFRR